MPVWPAPPKITKSKLPIFCPLEHCLKIIEKFHVHLHQHPQIPLNDEDNSCLTAGEIHRGAVKDMYDFCFQNDLSQTWAYLWNRWYTPKQWVLWARSADPAIYALKTTMVVESLWRNLKHRDLHEFNRPRLDLVTHIIITDVLPRVRRTLDYVLDLCRIGRPKALASWQEDFRADWKNMSLDDEHRVVMKQLEWLKKSKKTKGRAERLAQLDEEENRPRGKYLTEVDRWTCSCPAYLISRFLLCKHLVKEANQILNDAPLTDLSFFFNLRRRRYPPYYKMEGIHYEKINEEETEDEVEILVLGHAIQRTQMTSGSAMARTPQLSPSSPASSQHSNTATDNEGVAKDAEQDNNEKRAREGDRDVQEGEDSDEEENYSDPETERVSVVFESRALYPQDRY